MNLSEITPLVLTYNEEANIERTLAKLAWAQQIIVVDSGSTDRTVAITAGFSNTRLVERPFDNHTAQWNFGLEQIQSPWVLAVDADYTCPNNLADELQRLTPACHAYQAGFRYCVQGKPLRGSLYPPRVMLFRVDQFRYKPDGHTQLLDVAEDIGELESMILHDDRKPLNRWLAAQTAYADLEVTKLLTASSSSLNWKDRLRKQMVWMPLLMIPYCLFYKGLILDRWPGIYYTLQRVYAELLLSLKLVDARLCRSRPAGDEAL